MAQVSFPLTTFQDSDGNPVSFGYVLVKLSEDVQTPTPAQLCAFAVAKIALDTNGVVTGSPLVWPNSELSPSGSVYIYSVYAQTGQEVVREATLTV